MVRHLDNTVLVVSVKSSKLDFLTKNKNYNLDNILLCFFYIYLCKELVFL